jgi:Flp pilus assembly protein TadG
MKIKHERGQSLVELGISLAILIFLLAGAVEFGMAFFQFVQLRDAAQEGALYGSINPTNLAGIEERARGASNSPVNLSLAAPNPAKVRIYIDNVLVREDAVSTGASVSACEGHGLEVRVSFNHQIFMPFIPAFIGSSTIPLNATVTDTILTPIC